MSKRYKFKALDHRTGFLERAIYLLEDGEKKGIRTREPDPEHPLSRPRTIGMDRAQYISGLKYTTTEDGGMTWTIGYDTETTLHWEWRGPQPLALYSGGATFVYTEA